MSLFGGMPLPVQFFLAFAIVLGLIVATAWAVRRFGSGRLGGVGLRGRQPRLAVIDYASVDGRRRLILVRRDNVEHLLMIGGPTDIVVEPGIVRAIAAPRDTAASRMTAAAETLPRAIPLPDSATDESWPLQPEPTAPMAPPRAPRGEPPPEEPAWTLQPQAEVPPPRPQRNTLAALADELSTPIRPAPPRSRPAPPPRQQAAEPRQESRAEPRAEPRMPPLQTAAEAPPVTDQSLAEMAQRLEAALRKPTAKAETREARAPAPPRRAAPTEEQPPAPPEETEAPPSLPTPAAPVPAAPAPLAPAQATRAPRPAEAKPPSVDARQPNSGKALYDSLEQEMASLLGRPTNKT